MEGTGAGATSQMAIAPLLNCKLSSRVKRNFWPIIVYQLFCFSE